MAYDITPSNTGASVSAQDANAVREMWQRGVDIHDQSSDFFKPMEGKGEDAVICVKNDTSKGRGQKITFTNLSGFYKEPHHGDDIFEDSSHYEKARIGTFELEVDWMRHATSYNKRMEEVMGMRYELANNFPEELGKWIGRQKTEKLQMSLIHEGGADVTHYAGGAGSVDDLTSSDTLTYDELLKAGYVLKPRGGMPAKVGKDGAGNPIYKYCVVGATPGLFSLKNDSTYRQQVRDGGERGMNNYIFKGGYANLDGHIVKEYNPIDHDGVGPVGSPQNPKMELGNAITAGTTQIDITGGGDASAASETDILYSKWFPNYAYKFHEGNTLTAATDDFYAIVYNTSGADKGKWGFYKVDTNNGNKLTIKNETGDSSGAGGRLGSATSGVRSTQVGNVVWDAAVNTDAHPSGSTVILANANGVPVGHTFVLGRKAAFRGYGMYRNHRSQQIQEGGFITQVFVTTVFGQTPRFDRKGRARGYLTVTHALQYPEMGIVPTLA